jgi:hypothetical protein
MTIELLTGLSSVAVRDVVDDAMSDEAAELIREHHDKGVAKARAVGKGRECVWPPLPLALLSEVAAKCTVLQQKRRSTLAEVLPALEKLVAEF